MRGVDTMHYRARIDAAAVQALVDKQSSAVLPPQALDLLSGGSADVWLSDGDALPRRLRVQLDADGMQMTFAFELFEYGVDVRVTAPSAASVIDATTQQDAQQLLR